MRDFVRLRPRRFLCRTPDEVHKATRRTREGVWRPLGMKTLISEKDEVVDAAPSRVCFGSRGGKIKS